MLILLYRNWKYEQELASLLWKVDYDDIKRKGQNGSARSVGSRVSIISLRLTALSVCSLSEHRRSITRGNREASSLSKSSIMFYLTVARILGILCDVYIFTLEQIIVLNEYCTYNKPIPKISHVKTLQNLCKMRYKTHKKTIRK